MTRALPAWAVRALAPLAPLGRRLAWVAARVALAVAVGVVATGAWRSSLHDPSPTWLLVDRHGAPLGEAGSSGDDAGYWPVDPLPARVVAATLAVEDRRFSRHPGIDPLAIVRAVIQNVRSGGRVSGASTLAMQVARMQHPGSRGYLRKAVEAVSALGLTLRHGREAVLAQYLRIVPYGNRVHGIAYAARRYLDKPVDDLSWAETAFLAAIPQAPARHNPLTPAGRVRAISRAGRILRALRADGVLSAAEHELAQAELLRLRLPPSVERPVDALHAVLRLERDLRTTGAAPGVVRTTLDLARQQEVGHILRENLRRWEAQGAKNAAIVVVDRERHEVRAWVASAGYFDARRAGSIDYTAVARSPGSALKPFVYALALENGAITPATILDDLDRGPGGITNADDRFLGPLLPRVALANSRNVPAAQLVARVGVDATWDALRDLGLHDGRERARRYGLGLALGGLPVTLEQLVQAYTVFSTDGRRVPLRFHSQQALPPGRRVFSEATAREIALFLSDPQARLPSFPRSGPLEMPFPVAIKTGTSSRFRDAWAVGMSSRALVAAWVGEPDFRPMDRVTGYKAAALLVRQVLTGIHGDQRDGLADVGFPPPRDAAPVRLCALSGKRAGVACDRVVLEWMGSTETPVTLCPVHVQLPIDARDGRLASRATPASALELRTFVDLPPTYASWAAARGLPRPPAVASLARLRPTPQPTARVSITSPVDALRVLLDPETPAAQSTLALRAVVDPPVTQVVWYVDGQAWQVADYPYEARLPLVAGVHTLQVKAPSVAAASGVIRVTVE